MNKENLEQFFSHLQQEVTNVPDEVRRLFHGRGRKWQGLEQLTCDWLQGQLIVSLFREVDPDFLDDLRDGLLRFSMQPIWKEKNGTTILLQHRYQNGAPAEIILGDLDVHPVVEESGLKFKLDLGRNQNSGLFLDMRYGRDWVQQNAEGKRVLNLFAYTCGFSVAAIQGGAVKVVNVDMAKSSLSKGRDNHRLNGHDLKKVSFLAHDIFKSWGKIRKNGPYDLIVIDPPSFQKGSFALTKDYKKILRKLPELLADNGEVLACVNSPTVSTEFLIEGMLEEAPQFEYKERLENPPEFADLDEQSSLKALLFS
ncbi:class I SAM-dependent methyltransferase [Vibrio algarum]|uniref:Class I SAM-dependent methyltransferase n=1 Tax=Vibrio algarum TaxID=3020714 RepID=A0ABT4YQ60_9VIBR|nr:class I SAM-dependent methyltransferase [Vibrio sp. KJ40-1]MDB1123648.1 class I SAM-dependent methyltransferase [Vibrio sp. KJ40-1]